MAAILWTVFIALFIILLFGAKAMEVLISSNWYRSWFAKRQRFLAKLGKGLFDPFKPKLFLDLEEHLKTLNGDVVEVGIGSGENFDYYPYGTTLIAVDSNPHVEKFLRANVEKVGDRIHLKRFVATSAEDMKVCNGKVGVEDNSVAAVVCTKLLCSLTEDQIKRTIQEVKRVLMPVSIARRPGWVGCRSGSWGGGGGTFLLPLDRVWFFWPHFLEQGVQIYLAYFCPKQDRNLSQTGYG